MNESQFTRVVPAPVRDDGPDLEAQTFQVCEWKAGTPELTADSAVQCELTHGLSAALSHGYERELLKPHRIIRTRPLSDGE